MSDVNAVIVQPFKQFVKASRAASKTRALPAGRARRVAPAPPHYCAAAAVARRITQHTHRAALPRHRRARRVAPAPPPHYCATHTPPPRRRRRRDTDTSHAQDSIHLVKKCTKPDRKEFARIASATMIGFLIMGFVGFFVKLVHIPINNILMT